MNNCMRETMDSVSYFEMGRSLDEVFQTGFVLVLQYIQ